ncbi:hypothetical protein RhiirA1_468556 [Rhizophagus irregularis]|uniref:F-box domain-containing protein n=1 Tax=Rhizophagus irregularis TaxID=588596 RepID=A0A2N0R9U2_9GLOM|nr:hypothetical protein RhiirA1_468556 [Rhizophagus irregularis]
MPAKISTITYIHDSTERLIQDYMVKEIIAVSRTDDNDATKVIYLKEILPELINEIIQYFRKDFLILYSCILINRSWCDLTIPLLWEDPFSSGYFGN